MKYQGDATIGVSLSVRTPKPLDARLVATTREDLYSMPAKYAYEGMAVACLADGNIYTLLDKNNIDNKLGWKASYEAVQIITCTEDEYNEWLANTDSNYSPIDESKTWLHQDTYYYIFEDSIPDKGQYYVSQSQFEELNNRVNTKAPSVLLTQLSNKLDQELTNIANSYATKQEVTDQLDTKANTTDLDNYYTKENTDNKFVTKDSLRGDDIEGDDFVFVTQSKYNQDKEEFNQKITEQLNDGLSTKVDTDSDASLNSVTTKTIKCGDTTITLTDGEVNINGNIVASNINDIVCLSEEDYQALGDKIKQGTYYFTYGDSINNSGYVTSNDLNIAVKRVLANVTKLTSESTLEDCINKINEIISRYETFN